MTQDKRRPLLPPDTTPPAPTGHYHDEAGYDASCCKPEDRTTTPAPDVQAQDDDLIARLRNRAKVSDHEHLAEVAKVDVDEVCRRLSDVQAQIDAAVAACEQRCATQLADYVSRAADDERVRTAAAVAREREAQSVDAAAFRLLRDEADAADAWHAETGMKVARPPRMSPATVKHIRNAEIRARSAKGES